MQLYEKIRNLRKNKHWTQNHFANKVGVSRQTISKWESGFVFPSQENLVKICEAFAITMDEILNEIEPIHHKSKNRKKYIIGLFFVTLCICVVLFNLPEPRNYKYTVSKSLEELRTYEKIKFGVYTEVPLVHVFVNQLYMTKDSDKLLIEVQFDNDEPIYLNFHDSKRRVEIQTQTEIPAYSTYYGIELKEEILNVMKDLEIEMFQLKQGDSNRHKSQETVTLCKIRVAEDVFYKMKTKSSQ